MNKNEIQAKLLGLQAGHEQECAAFQEFLATVYGLNPDLVLLSLEDVKKKSERDVKLTGNFKEDFIACNRKFIAWAAYLAIQEGMISHLKKLAGDRHENESKL